MNKPLNNKIFSLLSVLVLVTTLVLLVVVFNSVRTSITNNLDDRMELAKTVVFRELINRQNAVLQNSKVLLDDFAFKRSLAAKNSDDIENALASFRYTMDAAFIKVQSPKLNFSASSGDLAKLISSADETAAMNFTAQDGDFANLIVIDQKLVWVLWMPIKNNSGAITAYASLGFLVNERYVQSIKQIVGIDLTVLVNAEQFFTISTLRDEKADLAIIEKSLINNHRYSLFFMNPLKNESQLLSSKFSLPNLGDINPTVYLSIDSTQIQSNFMNLQLTISAVALFALLCAISAGRVLANQITRPIEYLAKYATNIANGKYSKGMELKATSKELSLLLNAFNTMESNVKNRESEIVHQAQHDMLTGLYNRNYVTKHIDSLLNSQTVFQAIGVNIQRFRSINDVFGYQYGDSCLIELANRISNLGGVSARLEGGEILWLPESPLSIDQIKQIKNDIQAPIQGDNVKIPLNVSLGIVNCPSDTKNAEDLYRRLNIVIDQAQIDKSMIVEFENVLEANYLRRLAIVQKLERAITAKSKDIYLHYQPKLNIKTGQYDSAEALVRWADKDLGQIAPDEFIAIVEQAGLINALTKHVLNLAVTDIVALKKQKIDICMAINISAQDIMHDGFLAFTSDLLQSKGLSPSVLSLELTESAIMKEPQKAIKQMALMREAGFSIAIDDFGTGYSSFEYITQLPVDMIKIDKCFVMPIAIKQGEQAVCQAILKVANSFNMKVVAEGIEDKEALDMLTKWGCDYGQGYHIARPLPLEHFSIWLAKHNTTKVIL